MAPSGSPSSFWPTASRWKFPRLTSICTRWTSSLINALAESTGKSKDWYWFWSCAGLYKQTVLWRLHWFCWVMSIYVWYVNKLYKAIFILYVDCVYMLLFFSPWWSFQGGGGLHGSTFQGDNLWRLSASLWWEEKPLHCQPTSCRLCWGETLQWKPWKLGHIYVWPKLSNN